MSSKTGPKKDVLAKYIEIDLAENTTKKAMAIRKSKELSAVLGKPEDVSLGACLRRFCESRPLNILRHLYQAGGGTALHSPVYHLLAADLRSPPTDSLTPLLATRPDPLLSPSLPTLLLFECVLAYMRPEASNAILQWFTSYFDALPESGRGVLGCIVYEMFALEDAFGKVMVNNLKVSVSSNLSPFIVKTVSGLGIAGIIYPGSWLFLAVLGVFLS